MLQRLEATVAGVALVGTRDVPNAQYYYYATEIGRDPNRPEAESHPLDLLIRPDAAGPKTNGTADQRLHGRARQRRRRAAPADAEAADVGSDPAPSKDE